MRENESILFHAGQFSEDWIF